MTPSPLTIERGKALLEHVGGSTATAIAREIAVRMELRPEQEKQRVKALRKALGMRGEISIEICLEIEEIRGLAHGVIYRRMDDAEQNEHSRLERLYGALPVDVSANGNGHKNGNGEREPHCTLVDDLRFDFSNQLAMTIIQRIGPVRSEEVAPSATEQLPSEPKKIEHEFGGSMLIDDAIVLPFLIPDDDGKVVDSVFIPLPGGGSIGLTMRGSTLACNAPHATLKRTKNGYLLRYNESPLQALTRLIPED